MEATKPKTAKYVSKYQSLTIAVKSSYYKAGDDGKKELVAGNRVVFSGGFFETNDEELMSLLEKRADFGSAFVRVPENKTVTQMHDSMKAVDEKERELAKREEALAKREKLLADAETGRKETSEGAQVQYAKEDLEEMKRDDLIAIAESLEIAPEVYKVGKKNVDIAQAILEKQEEGAFAL